ncbi:hypothetical protein RO3G_02502 [Rhizopus delemar RA 99-880]|uniref:Guanine nucleotide-binding protein subunit gamma n=1 Tax=Rhizopus delemar (strain RA 99-880 / ATCC MYA-4621 / FGSC 9543 / NRRL 43880) TaxID=246409 RepID=I1BNL8_RHIO9|nr:hypothetical protein RO3G_02502 [Rhizopus delemar RA 99-880]|eukprot:EIE77798.1 hypothetical protein RO3G_02502 [Rhizopus delemar RA 99-880]
MNSKRTQVSMLRILEENNNHLRHELNLLRTSVSDASTSLINYCNNHEDPLLPSIWGPLPKKNNPFASPDTEKCCSVM